MEFIWTDNVKFDELRLDQDEIGIIFNNGIKYKINP